MESPQGPAQSRWTEVERTFQLACGVIVASAGTAIAVSNERFVHLTNPEATAVYALRILKVLLLISVGALIFRWIFAVSGEMRMLRDFFPSQIRPVRGEVYVWTVIFSVIVGILFALTGHIVAFSAVFALYSVGDIWGQRLRDEQLREGFEGARSEEANDELRYKRQTIEEYYLRRPQIPRAATNMFFAFVALSISLGAQGHDQSVQNRARVVSYLVIMLSILVSEFVIWRWRSGRDRRLGDRYSF